MGYRRITISVPEEVAAKAARAAESGSVESVSAYFAQLAEREPDWAEADRILTEMIDETGGVSDADEQWADTVLDDDSDVDAA